MKSEITIDDVVMMQESPDLYRNSGLKPKNVDYLCGLSLQAYMHLSFPGNSVKPFNFEETRNMDTLQFKEAMQRAKHDSNYMASVDYFIEKLSMSPFKGDGKVLREKSGFLRMINYDSLNCNKQNLFDNVEGSNREGIEIFSELIMRGYDQQFLIKLHEEAKKQKGVIVGINDGSPSEKYSLNMPVAFWNE